MHRANRTGILLTGIVFFLLLFLFMGSSGVAADQEALILSAAAGNDIAIFINEHQMAMQNPPLLMEGRVFLPARFFLEALGGVVEWNPSTRVVTAILGETHLELPVEADEARLNGVPVPLDSPARIVSGRTFVPLRFLVESVGGEVYWEEKARRVNITLEEVLEVPFLPGDQDPESPGPGDPDPEQPADKPGDEPRLYDGLDFEVETAGIYLGDPADAVLQVLGEPARRETSIYGYRWWVYNQNPLEHLQVGIKDEKVVAVYIYGDNWSFGPLKPGDKLSELEERFEAAEGFFLEENRTFYRFIRPTFTFPGLVASFYHDGAAGDALVALRLEERKTAEERFKQFFLYRSNKGDRVAYDAAGMREAEAADERQLFDLVNAARAREGLAPLRWNELTARAARGHSREMYLHDYFSHVSPLTGRTLAQRLDAQNVDFGLAAENIARGQMDAIEGHHDLMNSLPHRQNILHEDFLLLGVGVYGDCFTQNFVTLR